jgi:hypothetical protein
MDYHLQLRMGSASWVPPRLGQPLPGRLPLTTTPSAREHCRQETAAEQPANATASRLNAGRSRRHGTKVPPRPDQAQIDAQVKQLHFWLKVFSRFCQDDSAD